MDSNTSRGLIKNTQKLGCMWMLVFCCFMSISIYHTDAPEFLVWSCHSKDYKNAKNSHVKETFPLDSERYNSAFLWWNWY